MKRRSNFSFWLILVACAVAAGVVGLTRHRGAEEAPASTPATSAEAPVAAAGGAGNVSGPFHSYHLKNGMELVVVPNTRVPAVSHILWFRVGAADDPMGKSGIAHFLEHMMFRGTKDVQENGYAKQIQRWGGEVNAFTGHDFTGFYVNIAKEHLEDIMKLEADRLQNLAPTDESFQTERKVILEERKERIDNNPYALLSEQMNAALYQRHPYQTPIIGWPQEMESLTRADAEAFYREHYHAGNMVLVIAGDVEPEAVYHLADEYYGALPAKEPYLRAWPNEPKQLAPRVVTFRHEHITQPIWQREYIAPSMVYGTKEDAMPLMLLAQLMGQDKTGLLYEKLVEKEKIASSVSVGYDGLSYGPSSFSIAVIPVPGVTMDIITKSVDEAVKEVTSTAFPEAAIVRAKTLLKAETIYARDGLQPMAHFAGYIRVLGLDLSVFTQWSDLVDGVDSAQITKAAASTLLEAQSVTGLALPLQGGADAAHP